MNQIRGAETWQDFKKLLKIVGVAFLIALAFFGLINIVQAIPK